MTVNIFTNMPFSQFHNFKIFAEFWTIEDKVVSSWNSPSINVLLFTTFLTWEFFRPALSSSLFVENGGKMHFYALNSPNAEKLRACRKNSQVKKLVNNNTIILDEFQEFTTLSSIVPNSANILKLWNWEKGIFVNMFTVKLL